MTAPTEAASTVHVIRTAGQPDRTVRVVRPAKDADGMAEVKDAATGQTFFIPGRVLAKLTSANTPPPKPVAKLEPLTEPKPRATDPVFDSNLPAVLPARGTQLPPQPTAAPPVVPAVATERVVTTWRADDPPKPPAVLPPVKVSPAAPADPWRTAGQPAEPAAPPKVVPAAAWQPTAPPAGTPTTADPWRPSGK